MNDDVIFLLPRYRHLVSRDRTGVATIVALYRVPYAGRHDAHLERQRRALAISNSLTMGTWALVVFNDQENNRLRLRFPLRGPSVFSLDRGASTPLQFPSGISLIDRKDRTMQNIAEFRIIGRVGKITEHEKVTKVSVAANYNARRTESG